MTRFTRHSDSHLFGNSPSESAMNSGAKSVIETLCSKQNVDDHFNHGKKGKKLGALNPNLMVYYQFSKYTISSYWEPISQPNSCMLFLSPLFRQTHISSEKVVWWVKWKMVPSPRALPFRKGSDVLQRGDQEDSYGKIGAEIEFKRVQSYPQKAFWIVYFSEKWTPVYLMAPWKWT